MKYTKKMTVKEWKKFGKLESAENIGNSMQFYNFHTQRYKSYDYITKQEVLLDRYKIILTDHTTKRYTKVRYPNEAMKLAKVGVMCHVGIKEKVKESIKSMPSKITAQNINKGIKTTSQFLTKLDKTMNQLSKDLNEGSMFADSKKRKTRKQKVKIKFF